MMVSQQWNLFSAVGAGWCAVVFLFLVIAVPAHAIDRVALSDTDPYAACDRLPKTEQRACNDRVDTMRMHQAKKSKNIGICKRLRNVHTVDHCIFDIASLTNNVRVCAELPLLPLSECKKAIRKKKPAQSFIDRPDRQVETLGVSFSVHLMNGDFIVHEVMANKERIMKGFYGKDLLLLGELLIPANTPEYVPCTVTTMLDGKTANKRSLPANYRLAQDYVLSPRRAKELRYTATCFLNGQKLGTASTKIKMTYK